VYGILASFDKLMNPPYSLAGRARLGGTPRDEAAADSGKYQHVVQRSIIFIEWAVNKD
jgi:hypothetical protein